MSKIIVISDIKEVEDVGRREIEIEHAPADMKACGYAARIDPREEDLTFERELVPVREFYYNEGGLVHTTKIAVSRKVMQRIGVVFDCIDDQKEQISSLHKDNCVLRDNVRRAENLLELYADKVKNFEKATLWRRLCTAFNGVLR